MKYTIERADIEKDGTVELPEGAIFIALLSFGGVKFDVVKYLKPVNQAP